MRVFFLRDANKFPVACVAAEFHPKTNSLSWGISIFNPKDDFNRKTARDVAIGRMRAALNYKSFTPYRRTDELGDLPPKRFIMAILASCLYDGVTKMPYYPHRVQRAAALWLINHPPVQEKEVEEPL